LKRFSEQYVRLFEKLLTAALLTLCLSAQTFSAQQRPKVFVVKSKNIASYNLAVEGFKHKASGSNWSVVEYDLQGKLENADEMLKKLQNEMPSLVLAVGAKAMASVANSKIRQPIVFCMVMDTSVYDTGSCDATGVSLAISSQQQIEILTQLNPKIKKIGVLMRKRFPNKKLEQLSHTATKRGLELIPIEIENEKHVPPKLRPVLGKVDALCMLDDSFIHSKETLEYVVLKSIENNLPFMAISKVFVKEGALLSLSPSFFSNGEQAAELADKIISNGVKAHSIPVSYHKKPELVINLKIARKIRMNIPPVLLDRAKQVYE